MTKLLSCLLLLVSAPLAAQFTYTVDQQVPVLHDGDTLTKAWAGGLNSPQFNTIDLNGDGTEDLVVFDRTSPRIVPFIASAGEYIFAPQYQSQFPEGISNWLLLRDFNCDGKKDIFASDPRGVVVYVNTTTQSEPLSWRVFNFRADQGFKHLLTQGFTSAINLQINDSDLPVISDIDNDGDLDILTYRFSGASTVEFHKNFSMERDGTCDSLQYERVTQKWGSFEECECGAFAFNDEDCPPLSGGREEHQGGKSMLALDLNGDNVQEMIISEEECTSLFALSNTGTPESALISGVDSSFPNSNNPANFFIFPAAYSEDVDFDGKKDLLVAPNVPGNVSNAVNFQSSSWFYKNTGSVSIPNYSLVKRNFLQDEMVELGENAAPAFADVDADGDLDMIVGSYVNREANGFRASLTFYTNIGTASTPSFERQSTDYLTLSIFNFINLKPKFKDINTDGNLDLVFSASSLNAGGTDIYYILNQSNGGAMVFDTQNINVLFNLGSFISNNENFELFDISGDGLLDLLIGRSSGRLEYYRNIGTKEAADFELIDDSFYDLDFSPFRQSPSANIADYDADGKVDMLVGDARGNLTLFDSFLESVDMPKSGVSKLFRDEASGDSVALVLGSRLLPVAANIFNADKPAIIVGSGSGGLLMLKHTEANGSPVLPINGVLAVYPNPVRQVESLKIGVAEAMTVAITTITGQTIYKNIEFNANEVKAFDMSTFGSGLYIVVGRNSARSEFKRFVVIK